MSVPARRVTAGKGLRPVLPPSGEPMSVTSPDCRHLGNVALVPGSGRTFRVCNGGRGSTTEDLRKGLVVVCNSCSVTPGVWRLGQECGPGCGGFERTLPAEAKGPVPPQSRVLALTPPSQTASQPTAYGVITVPARRLTTLPGTLASLARAGFDAPTLFVDADARDGTSYENTGLTVVKRRGRVMAFGNWLLALAELYLSSPRSGLYVLFQDDLLAAEGLREYLEETPPPDDAYFNLYTWPSNQGICPVGHVGWYRSNQFGRGAVGLAFNRRGVLDLLKSADLWERYQQADQDRAVRVIDGAVVECLKKLGYTELVHNPSLLQHTGDESQVKPGKTSLKSPSFCGRVRPL